MVLPNRRIWNLKCNGDYEKPGCAVKKAIEEGTLAEKRLKLYQRLTIE